jgi:membrane associated rhomboid family serine protease
VSGNGDEQNGSTRDTALDVAVLTLVPGFLAVVHYALPGLSTRLAFEHTGIRPVEMWTSGFVHLNDGHLQDNLYGYALTAVPLYVLYQFAWDRLRRFWVTFAAVVLVAPFVSSLGSYLYWQSVAPEATPTSRGFSGVVAALAGALLVSVLAYVADEYGRQRAAQVGPLVVLVPISAVAVGVFDGLPLRLAGLIAFGLVLGIWNATSGYGAEFRAVLDDELVPILVVGYCVAVLAVVLPLLFPSTVVQEESVTDVAGHFSGLCAGFVSTIITCRRL